MDGIKVSADPQGSPAAYYPRMTRADCRARDLRSAGQKAGTGPDGSDEQAINGLISFALTGLEHTWHRFCSLSMRFRRAGLIRKAGSVGPPVRGGPAGTGSRGPNPVGK